jgi:MGT family glycosyltransferase
MKYLFLANPAIGHIISLISIGTRMIESGHEILFMIPGIPNKKIRTTLKKVEFSIPDKLEAKNIPCKVIPVSIRQCYIGLSLSKKHNKKEPVTVSSVRIFLAGAKKYISFIEKALEEFKPDAIIYDFTFLPAIAVSEKHDIPRVAIYLTGLPFYEYPVPDIGSNYRYNNYPRELFEANFDNAKKIESIIREKYEKIIKKKLDIPFFLNPNSKFLNIITTIKEAEFPRNNLDETVYFAGPCLHGMAFDKPHIEKIKRIIYISLGTFFDKQPELFDLMIDLCKSQDAEIIVTAGKSYKILREKYKNHNVTVYEYVAQSEILKKADLFLTHGGRNSIIEALKYGVPMIVFPPASENEYNAKLIEYLGCGRMIENINATEINKAIREVFHGEAYWENTMKISEKMNRVNGASRAVEIIDAKLQTVKKCLH